MIFGKIDFIQKLAVTKFFEKIVKAEWVSSIQLRKTRETEIQSCFDCNLSFQYPQNLKTFDDLLDDFKVQKSIDNTNSIDNNNYGENKKTDCLIVMDDISGLADRSKRFASFLTIARKYVSISLCLYFSYYFARKINFEKKYIANKHF